MQVLDVKRGEQAAKAVREVNQFNAPAPEGKEYLAVKVRVKDIIIDGQSHRIGGDFRVTGDRLVEYFMSGVVPPDPALDFELFRGGQAEGWIVYPIGQGEGRLLLGFDPLDVSANRPIFVALTPDAASRRGRWR